MEDIIKKAIKGGYSGINDLTGTWHGIKTHIIHRYYPLAVLDPLFWTALGKSCGWVEYAVCRTHGNQQCFKSKCWDADGREWMYHAIQFHEINLTEGWDPAIAYLTNLIKS